MVLAELAIGSDLDLRFDELVCGQVELYHLQPWLVRDDLLGILQPVAVEAHFNLRAALPARGEHRGQVRGYGFCLNRRAQEQGFGTELDPEHTGAAIALLFENFTVVSLRPSGLGLQISDTDAIATLSTIWKKTLYGF